MRKAIIIGLTGQTGAGKTTVAEGLRHFGYQVIKADDIARLVTETGSPTLRQLAAVFGKDILRADGSLDRALLAERAFSSTENTKLLNGITHPEILRLINKKINGAFFDGYEGVVLDASQLFESGLNERCTLVLSVVAPEALRLRRIMARDGISEEQARQRMSVQLSEDFFRTHSNYVLENTGTEEDLKLQLRQIAAILEEHIAGER
ncbi:MAG: dephospho-CoA kinase [Clostridia bacterium]|nr:dephospho-CoA kinase [Clostridia bacterium]MBR1704998.1 dephospho-CoA kinase [Clostridia bacterium]